MMKSLAPATLALLLSSLASAQTLDRAVPAAAAPGDLVILEGSGLGSTTHVRFTGTVGFPTPTVSIDVVPELVTADAVHARVPLFSSFIGCQWIEPSSPYGWVEIVTPDTPPPPLTFFYMEDIGGGTFSMGLGSSQSGGAGRSVISFDIQQGPLVVPLSGFTMDPFNCQQMSINPAFVLTLENALPGSPAWLTFGAVSHPFLPFDDGLYALDVSSITFLFVGSVGPDGTLALPISLPPTFFGAIGLQWLTFDAGAGDFAISNGVWTGY